MNSSSRLFILLAAFALVISSCRFSGYSAKYLSNNAKQSRPVVYPDVFSKALYKTDLTIYGRQLTGITVIKKDTSGYHLALVSEVGLKYYELFFPLNPAKEAQVIYLMEVMNHPPVVTGLKNVFSLLFREPQFDEKAHLKMNETGKTCLLYNKDKHGATQYYFDWMTGDVHKLQQKKIFGSRTEINISAYKENIPNDLLLLRGKISMQLNRMH